MSLKRLDLAVVGHTNTGKTSLLRTLTREEEFGEVSDRPATTRHVEETDLLVAGRPALALYDTPGLEDPGAVLERLAEIKDRDGGDWTDALQSFVSATTPDDGLSQEAKALAQVLAADAALFVIDAREPVLARHRDELEILGRSARPVLPVLNFVASPEARVELWRSHLARVNMHAVVPFDTVVYEEAGELSLYEKMATLLDPFRETLEALIAEVKARREAARAAAAEALAELAIQAAALEEALSEDSETARDAARGRLGDALAARESTTISQLFEIFRFQPGEDLPGAPALEGTSWKSDPFSLEALKDFGLDAGSGAAAGAVAGLAIDAMTGGLSLGAAALVGAGVGAGVQVVRGHGQALMDRIRGRSALAIEERVLRLVLLRQIALVRALLARGHASQSPLGVTAPTEKLATAMKDELAEIIEALGEARQRPDWAEPGQTASLLPDNRRRQLATRLAEPLRAAFAKSVG